MVAVGQKHYSRAEFTITVHKKLNCADFTIHSQKKLHCFGHAWKLHGDILKPFNGVSNKKNINDKPMERCLLNKVNKFG